MELVGVGALKYVEHSDPNSPRGLPMELVGVGRLKYREGPAASSASTLLQSQVLV